MRYSSSCFPSFVRFRRSPSNSASSSLLPLASLSSSSARGNAGNNFKTNEKEVWKLPRIYLDRELPVGSLVECDTSVSHYLSRVMRLREGQCFRAFNCSIRHSDSEYQGGHRSTPASSASPVIKMKMEMEMEMHVSERVGAHAGEFLLRISRAPHSSSTSKRMRHGQHNHDQVYAEVVAKLRDGTTVVGRDRDRDRDNGTSASDIDEDEPPPSSLPVHMYFALIKKAKARILLEKATELGVARLTAVVTERCQREGGGGGGGGNAKSLEGWDAAEYSHVLVEATEQSERLRLPSLSAAPLPLADVLQQWQARREACGKSKSKQLPLQSGGSGEPAAEKEGDGEGEGGCPHYPRLFVCRERSDNASEAAAAAAARRTALEPGGLGLGLGLGLDVANVNRSSAGAHVALPLLTALLQCPPDQLLWKQPPPPTPHTPDPLRAPPASSASTSLLPSLLPPFGLLVGPEGGWSEAEMDLCAAHSVVTFVSLGRDVLRAETAGIAALATLAAAVNHCHATRQPRNKTAGQCEDNVNKLK